MAFVDLVLGDTFFVSYSGSTLLLGCINVTWWKTMSFLADSNAGNVAGMDVYKETLTRYWLYGTMKSLVNPFAYSTRLMRLSMLKKPSSHGIQKMLDSSSCSFIIAVCLDICSSGIECRGYRFSTGNAYGENYR